MKKHILSLIILSSVFTRPSYCMETSSEITSQQMHPSIPAQEIAYDDFDTRIAPDHTRESCLNNLTENHEKINSSTEKAGIDYNLPPPRHHESSPESRKLIQISETKYTGTKILPYKDIDGSIAQDEVHFCFEKLNFSNLIFWLMLVGKEQDDQLNSGSSKNNREGLCAFETTLT